MSCACAHAGHNFTSVLLEALEHADPGAAVTVTVTAALATTAAAAIAATNQQQLPRPCCRVCAIMLAHH